MRLALLFPVARPQADGDEVYVGGWEGERNRLL